MRRLIAALALLAVLLWTGCNVTTNVISIRGSGNITTMSSAAADGGADIRLPAVNVNAEKEQ